MTETPIIQNQTEIISSQEKVKLISAATQTTRLLEKSVVVGGAAMRLHLIHNQMLTPAFVGNDIDITMPKEQYEILRSCLPIVGEKPVPDAQVIWDDEQVSKILRAYRRRGFHERSQTGTIISFCENPTRNMALWDIANRLHIDVFSDDTVNEEVIQTLTYSFNETVRVISPEEINRRWLLQAYRDFNNKSLQSRRVVYITLLKQLIDPEKMDLLWLEKTGNKQRWQDVMQTVMTAENLSGQVHGNEDGIIPN